MQIEDDGVKVLFACRCMTYDQSETKFWYHGEYEKLDLQTLEYKLDQHTLHCPYKGASNEIKAWTKTLQELSIY